jgi:L-amino acid N-acyltransferase YncA
MARSYRTGTLADLPAIIEIYNATIPSRQVTGDLEPIAVSSRISWFEAHRPESRPIWVAEQDEQVIAWLSFSDFYGRAAYAKTAELSIYVRRSARRSGWGSYLLSEAIAHGPQLGLSRLVAFIFEHNQPSLKLFYKHGFEQWGLLPGVAILNDVERGLIILGTVLD